MLIKFLRSICLFSLPVIITFFILETNSEPNQKQIKSLHTYSNLQRIEVLYLGPSTMSTAINPKYMTRPSTNLAIPGNSINLDYLIYQKISPKLPKLQIIVFDLSKGYLEDYKPKSNAYGSLLVHYNLVEPFKPHSINNLFLTTTNFKYAFNKFKNDYIYNQEEEIDETGFITKMIQRDDSFENLNYDINSIKNSDHVAKIFNLHSQYNEQAYKLNYEILTKLIYDTADKDIKLLFLSPPKYFLYKKIKNKYNDRRQMFLNFALDFEHVSFIDLESYQSENANNFYDIMHLNPFGAQTFSKYVNQNLDSLYPRQ